MFEKEERGANIHCYRRERYWTVAIIVYNSLCVSKYVELAYDCISRKIKGSTDRSWRSIKVNLAG